ncbi:uncharacterized protein N7511_000983 [Penicillium nucicola]|uniref:uncharacterized protein n=1 Tax=Penicillium nucicola TaxID=1850975 RepID=UPI0025455295|nr:uncharacterized protein N7511_000983 [Penicillium nucicola]KAJ5775972.1 hypothetical protein N7511_000983 [Penicillium nucicola]
MSSLSGPSTLGRETRFVPPDNIEVRACPFGNEPSKHQATTTRYGASDPKEVSRHGRMPVSSGEGKDPLLSKKQKLDHKAEPLSGQPSDIERILASLSPKTLQPTCSDADPSSGISQTTSILKPPPASYPTDSHQTHNQEDSTGELRRLRQELLVANSKIASQEQELAQTRVIKHTLDQALGPPSEADYNSHEIREPSIGSLQNIFIGSSSTFGQHQDSWVGQDDSQSDISDPLSGGSYGGARGPWARHELPLDRDYSVPFLASNNSSSQDPSHFWGTSDVYPPLTGPSSLQSQRILSGPSISPCGFYSRPIGDQTQILTSSIAGPRRSNIQCSRVGSLFPPQSNPWSDLSSASSSDHTPKSPKSPEKKPVGTFHQAGFYPVPSYPPRAIGSPLSPTASEFTGSSVNDSSWSTSTVSGNSIQTYVSPLEPLNYRRLLDKNVSCDWKYIVDKIVCSNDQQASIFLQQKLKVGTTEQKYDIIEAIVRQAYLLMVNRFGNFLVQRCFEHGTPEQVVAIANAISGNTLTLSMDPFGCHVIQKAFDCVPEEHKAVMVHELLRQIPETVIHRYACHVWQKLFELRWSGEPPQIMIKVNEALQGMWHEVALGETGSLVVQNIFENCVEDEKRPAIEEVLAKTDVLAHGQFGNWCIQHICEHGAPHDKSRAVEHVLHWAVDYSMDQFASKIVEKCLKIGGTEFMDRYLTRVCTGRSDRPRMPLIDIAGDQYGNYLIQWILMNAPSHQREVVASHIRKHMVSLRGSKFGSRVAMLCCNPSHATRPGPGAGMQIGRFNNFNEDKFSTTTQSSGRFGRGNQWGPNYAPVH